MSASSAYVRDASALPTRSSSSSLASMPATNAALRASIARSRSACEARRWPWPPGRPAISSPGHDIAAPPGTLREGAALAAAMRDLERSAHHPRFLSSLAFPERYGLRSGSDARHAVTPPLGCQPSEDLDIVDVLLPPGPPVAQMRELLFHGQHAGHAHSLHRRAIEHPRLVA